MEDDYKEAVNAFASNGKVYREMEQNCSEQSHLKYCYKDIAMTFEHNARLLTILTKSPKNSNSEPEEEVWQVDHIGI